MQLRYNYRLYPTPEQRSALARAFGCARVVFNDALRLREQAYMAGLAYVTDAELSARLTAAKATPERAWLAGVSSVVLQQSLADLNTAYRNFFASLTGRRKGPKIQPPRLRSRKDRRQAIRFTANAKFKILPGGKLRKLQKSLARKQPGSSNRDKARVAVARAHAKVTDSRRDFHHKTSTAIIRDNQAVYAEDLCVAGLDRTRLAKSVHDAGWSAFTGMLEYKARRYGRYFGKIGRWVPSTSPCSACGVNSGTKPLNVRQWTCTACGAVHDRDRNAAENILALGRRERLNACGDDVRPPLAMAVVNETGTLRGAA